MSGDPTGSAGAVLIWCPFPVAETAGRVVSQLLDEGLIACANVLPEMRSLYHWQGERGEAVECGVRLKTNRAEFAAAIARLALLHPYKTPAVLGWNCDSAASDTAAWLGRLGR